MVLAILGILAAILYPVTSSSHWPSRRSLCQSNLKQLGLGFAQYVQDAGEKYPPSSVAWGDAVRPYVKSWQIYQCPSVEDKRAEQSTDYYMNARLRGVKLNALQDDSLTILAGEGKSGQPLNAVLSALPTSWLKSPSPALRHLDGSNYLFADWHVKWLRPEKITLQPAGKNLPTFLIR